MRIALEGVKPIAFDVSARLVVEGEQRTIPNDRIGRGSKDALNVPLSPNDVSRGVGHLPFSKEAAPDARPGP